MVVTGVYLLRSPVVVVYPSLVTVSRARLVVCIPHIRLAVSDLVRLFLPLSICVKAVE